MKARTYKQTLTDGTWQYVVLTERWYCKKLKEYDYVGVAVKGSKVHEFHVSVRTVNRMIKSGTMKQIEIN